MEEEKLTGGARCAQFFSNYWKTLLILIVPLIFLPIPVMYPDPAFKCLYCVICIAIYWVTEVMPLPVTSLLPIGLFPLLGILETKKVCLQYFSDTVTMFLAGLILALAIEYSNLHKRIALGTILIVGCSLRRLHLGLSCVCCFMSLWIVNTAATAMFLPVIKAVLEELEENNVCALFLNGRKTPTEEERLKGEDLPIPSKITNCFYISLAYSASIGGCGTLIGTGTNLVFTGLYEGKFPSQEIDFLKFFCYAFPLTVLMEILMLIYLQALYLGFFRPNSKDAQEISIGKDAEKLALDIIKSKYKELGSMTAHERIVAIGFTLCVLLLFGRHPGFMTGWSIISDVKISGTSVGIVFSILLFMVPASCECCRFFTNRSDVPLKETKAAMAWSYIHTKMHWGLLLLLGGGFALAEGGKVSGMSKMIGEALSSLENLPPFAVLIVVIIASEGMTNLSSNVAIANIVLPVLAEMSLAIKIHPVFLMFPACLACSMAFHLPVGTPPNALIKGFAMIRSKDMAIAGVGATIITIICLWGWALSWGALIFPDTHDFPDWAQEALDNATSTK